MLDLIIGLSLVDWIGVAGSLIICGAYLAVSNGWVDATRAPFHLANLLGSVLLLISLYARPNAGAILIEVLWASIAIFSLVRLIRR